MADFRLNAALWTNRPPSVPRFPTIADPRRPGVPQVVAVDFIRPAPRELSCANRLVQIGR